MSAPENTRERLAEALRRERLPYGDGKGGWLFRAARPEEQADALLPLVDTLLAEQRAGIAAAIEALRINTATAAQDNLVDDASRIARTFGGER